MVSVTRKSIMFSRLKGWIINQQLQVYDDDFESDEEYVVDIEFEPDVYQDIPLSLDSQST